MEQLHSDIMDILLLLLPMLAVVGALPVKPSAKATME